MRSWESARRSVEVSADGLPELHGPGRPQLRRKTLRNHSQYRSAWAAIAEAAGGLAGQLHELIGFQTWTWAARIEWPMVGRINSSPTQISRGSSGAQLRHRPVMVVASRGRSFFDQRLIRLDAGIPIAGPHSADCRGRALSGRTELRRARNTLAPGGSECMWSALTQLPLALPSGRACQIASSSPWRSMRPAAALAASRPAQDVCTWLRKWPAGPIAHEADHQVP